MEVRGREEGGLFGAPVPRVILSLRGRRLVGCGTRGGLWIRRDVVDAWSDLLPVWVHDLRLNRF
jgi:hypothetical protein